MPQDRRADTLVPFTPVSFTLVSFTRASLTRLVVLTAFGACSLSAAAQFHKKAKPAAAPAAAAPLQTAPVPSVSAPASYPAVQADGTATFKLTMPNALKVELNLEGSAKPFPMTKGPDGEWTATVPKLAPQYYSYNFAVDGTDVLDPHNVTLKTGFLSVQNIFLVPGQPSMDWELANVPHGVIHHHGYHSNILGRDSEYYVYTPPGFDSTNTSKYPVLYLLHGYSDDASAWTGMGKANLILDNLIDRGKAVPMIVVMPLGYGSMDMIARGSTAWRDPELVTRNFTRFSSVLFDEVMPLVKQEYPLSDDREQHAITGLSMGGAESLLVGLNHTDYFAYVGSFSAGGLVESTFAASFPAITTQSAAQINTSLSVLWIACGTEDPLFAPNQKFVAWLKQQGLQPTAIQTPGMHTWMVWRNNLDKFLPLLFQPSGPR